MLAATAAARYNPRMRRPTRLAVIVVVLPLLVIGAYSAFWFVAASRVESGVADWAQSLQPQNLDLTWRAIRVGGFPFDFTVKLTDARLRDRAVVPVTEITAPNLTASARPWNFLIWRVTAPSGLSAAVGPPDEVAKLTARSAQASITVQSEGGGRMWLRAGEVEAEAGMRIAAHDVDLWLDLPAHNPQDHTEPALGAALDVHGVNLPTMPAPFRNPLDELSLGVTIMGPVPAAPPRQAAMAWRDAGGTLELDHFAMRWETLAITGSGTLALDADLQPIGGFSGAVEGYEELMAALVAAGRMRAGDAQLARLALAILAKAGPNGRPEISTSFTIQNRQMYLGPARLGPVPRIDWR